MRVSERQRYDTTIRRVENAKDNNSTMLEVLSTNKRLNRVSDDPVGFGQAIRDRSKIGSYKQYRKNIEYAKGYISKTETSIRSMHEFLIRAKELAVNMANATYGPTSRAAAGEEIREIMEAVVQLGNTTYGNRFIFGGFRNQTPPVSQNGDYVGDDGALYMQIDEQTFRQVNLQSRHLFEATPDERGAGHFNMLESLRILYTGLEDNDITSIRKALDELEFQHGKASSYEARLGSVYNALEDARSRLEFGEDLTREKLYHIEDAEMYRSVSDFKRTETILQSTLMASSKLLQPSLLNFMQ
jgi:flagellar hook-associated protein 3 FlgL